MRLSIVVLILAAIAVGAYYYAQVNREKQEEQKTGFSSIVVKGSGTLNLSQGNAENIKIRGITKDQVTIQNRNGVLTITPKGDASDAYYLVTVSDLRGITAEGRTRVISNDRFDIDDLTVIAKDKGHIYLSVKGKFVNARVENAADVLMSGIIDQQHVIVQNESKYESAGLVSRKATVSVANVGEAWVNVTEQLNATVTDNGILRYGGDPEKVTEKIQGSGILDRFK